ncbi:uncharacterized protein RCO7_00418 [Rhynchosporium graminicola]|uniref:SET domain-containing protein n=1 Tax=Rhynchosporium graminicola TaxID=2792576 RepID=A0A1E1KLX5_9HELO|nr:uncharacterized protein RCO7_00418 [Rhynchosporium commune]
MKRRLDALAIIAWSINARACPLDTSLHRMGLWNQDEKVIPSLELAEVMHNSQCSIGAPLMKGHHVYDPNFTATMLLGACLEPFAAFMAHNCDPSTKTIHEADELIIRATRDIAAGGGITRSWGLG